MDETRLLTTPLPQLGSLADLHVYMVPKDCWLPYQKIVRNHVIDEAISYGFIRVQSQVTLIDLRKDLEEQLENENLPRDYKFLRCVGRNFAQVKPKQELQLKVRDFMPPFASEPEIFLLESPQGWSGGGKIGVREEVGVVARRGSPRSRNQRRTRNTRARGPNQGVQFPALDSPPSLPPPPGVASSNSLPFPQLPPVPAKGRSETNAATLEAHNGNIVSLRPGAGRNVEAGQQLKFPRIEVDAYEDDSGDHREIRFYDNNSRIRGGADPKIRDPGGGPAASVVIPDTDESKNTYPAPSSLAGKPVPSMSVSRSLYRPKRVSVVANVLKNKHPNRSNPSRPNSHSHAVHHYHHYIVVPSLEDQTTNNGTHSTTIRLEALPTRGQTRRQRPAHGSLPSNSGRKRKPRKKDDSGSEASKSSSEISDPTIPTLALPSTPPDPLNPGDVRQVRRRARHAKCYAHESADDQLEALIRDYANFTPSSIATTTTTAATEVIKSEVQAMPIAEADPEPEPSAEPVTQVDDKTSRRRLRHAHCFPSESEGAVIAPSTVKKMALKTVRPVLPEQEPISPRRVLMPSGIEVLSLSEAKRIRHANCLTNEPVSRKIMSRSGIPKRSKASVIRPILKPPKISVTGDNDKNLSSSSTKNTISHTQDNSADNPQSQPLSTTTDSPPPLLMVPTLKQKKVNFSESSTSESTPDSLIRKPKVFIQGQHGTLQEITNTSIGVRKSPSPKPSRKQQHVVTFADKPTYASPVRVEDSDVQGTGSSGEGRSEAKGESPLEQATVVLPSRKGPPKSNVIERRRRKERPTKRSSGRRPTSIQVTVDIGPLNGHNESVAAVLDSNGVSETTEQGGEKKPSRTRVQSLSGKKQPVSWVIDHVHIEEFPDQVASLETQETPPQTSTTTDRHAMSPLLPRRKLLPPPVSSDSPIAADVSESESPSSTSPPYPQPQRTILLCSIDRR